MVHDAISEKAIQDAVQVCFDRARAAAVFAR
jgi:hypothetical protein